MRESDRREIVEAAAISSPVDAFVFWVLLGMVGESAEVWPAVGYVARLTRYSSRTIFRSLNRLQEAGLVTSVRAPGRVSRRRLPSIRSWIDDSGLRRWAPVKAELAESAAPSDDPEPSADARARHLAKVGPRARDFGAARCLRPDFEPAPETALELDAINLPAEQKKREISKFQDYYLYGRGRKAKAQNWDWKLVDWLKNAERHHQKRLTTLASSQYSTKNPAPTRYWSPEEAAKIKTSLLADLKIFGAYNINVQTTMRGTLKVHMDLRGAQTVVVFGLSPDEIKTKLLGKLRLATAA